MSATAVEITWSVIFGTGTIFLFLMYSSCILFAVLYDCEKFKGNHIAPSGWLYINGSIGILNTIINIFAYKINLSKTEVGNKFRKNRRYVILILYIFALFLCLWNLVGSIEIMGAYNYGPNYQFCNRNVIILTWFVIITKWVFYIVVITFFAWKLIKMLKIKVKTVGSESSSGSDTD